jgi:hypothetical protein
MSNEKLRAQLIIERPLTAPLLLRRAIVDVMFKPQLHGRTVLERFEGAVAIAIASLEGTTRHAPPKTGQPPKPGDRKLPALKTGTLGLSAAGTIRNNQKRFVPDARLKEAIFDNLIDVVRSDPGSTMRMEEIARLPITGRPRQRPGQLQPPATPPVKQPSKAGFPPSQFGPQFGPTGLQTGKGPGGAPPAGAPGAPPS